LDFALILPPGESRGARLLEALREAILSGRVPAGERLPPSRTLAAQLSLSRGTVVGAYEELVSEGYCAARVGAGTFVTMTITPGRTAPIEQSPPCLSVWGQRLEGPEQLQIASHPPTRAQFDFRPGITPETFPALALGRALRHAAADLAMEHGVGDPAGSPRLRAAIAAYLARARAVRVDPSQVIVVSGSQQGLDLVTRLLLDPGDRVAMEEPGYSRARAIFRAAGAAIVAVPVDRGGMNVATLPAAGADMVYVTPSHQFPTGAVLGPERRLALLDWVQRHGAWLIEDDYDSEIRYSGPPLPSLQGLDRAERCIYLGSLSKLLHPALRVGYLVVPRALIAAARLAKGTLDQATSPMIQEALADLFESGEIERHLRRALRIYRIRRSRMVAALKQLPVGATVWPVSGGLHAFVELPRPDPDRLRACATERGIALLDAGGCYQTPPDGIQLILWFGRIPLACITPGIAALGEAITAA